MPCELWLAKLDRLAASQAEINSIVTDALQFISGLRFTLDQGLPQEKLCALRQCIERILIDKPGGSVVVKIKAVPASTIQEFEEPGAWTNKDTLRRQTVSPLSTRCME